LKLKRVNYLIIVVLLSITSVIYANDYSFEANYIYKNQVEITRIDSFIFNSDHSLEEKGFVSHSLIRYSSKEAIELLIKMLNDPNPALQSFSIMPLINAGEFDMAFNKYKELILQSNREMFFNLGISNQIEEFSIKKSQIYNKNKHHFIPFLLKVCVNDSVSYFMKYHCARTLSNLGEKEILRLVSIEILANVPDPEKSSTLSGDYTLDDQRNWQLRHQAKSTLEKFYGEKE
jgi:hypothetical protein